MPACENYSRQDLIWSSVGNQLKKGTFDSIMQNALFSHWGSESVLDAASPRQEAKAAIIIVIQGEHAIARITVPPIERRAGTSQANAKYTSKKTTATTVKTANTLLGDLEDGNLKWSTDLRGVYATLLSDWLSIPAGEILAGKFPRCRCSRPEARWVQ
jgi:hypothetical protein